MEKTKLFIYWLTTLLVATGMTGSGLAQILQAKEMVDLIAPLGYPL
ncbi:hypothetical protein [Mucilaginibacter rigui]|nr:hypothetical protein [Mucilaginibacter rigui]